MNVCVRINKPREYLLQVNVFMSIIFEKGAINVKRWIIFIFNKSFTIWIEYWRIVCMQFEFPVLIFIPRTRFTFNSKINKTNSFIFCLMRTKDTKQNSQISIEIWWHTQILFLCSNLPESHRSNWMNGNRNCFDNSIMFNPSMIKTTIFEQPMQWS